MKQIKSESEFLRKLIMDLIKIPFLFVLFLFGKVKIRRILQPVSDLTNFLVEAKITFTLIMINIFAFFIPSYLYAIGYIDIRFYETYLVSYPSYLFELKLLPIIVSWFMHANTIHLFTNMLFLFIFGRVVEKTFKVKLLLIYFGSAIISTLVHSITYIYFLNQNTPGLGASGAIAGLIATGMLSKPFYLTYLFFPLLGIPIPIMVVGWAFLVTEILGIINQETMIGHYAHLGGFFAITLIIFLLSKQERRSLIKGFIINIVSIILVVLIATILSMKFIS